ncbi:MAG: GtrA family protein [Paludibacter sp.]|jgi:putative flippase GtrA|nr:GtrA family protein [Paludibacter sp.]
MFNNIKKLLQTFSSRGGVFMFMRAQLSSQMATVIDNSVAFLLKKTFDIFKLKVIYFFSRGIEAYVFATIVGQILGGLFVCFINYKWTFKAKDIKFRFIFFKFLLVWFGSIALNTYFTFYFTESIKEYPFLVKALGANSDDIFIIVKLLVAIIVGFFWNYTMYRRFVYKDISIKQFVKTFLSINKNKVSKDECLAEEFFEENIEK